ncbi:MFS transporter [Geodermatophilus sp. SYSU D00696]
MAAARPTGYVSVLRVPGAFAFSASATLVRLAQAMLGLGSVLLLVQLGRSYAVAGLVAGAISAAQGVVGPQVSRLVDVHGQRAVVLPQVLVHAAAVSGLVVASLAGAPTWLLAGTALVVGGSLPQAGALARARWTALLDDPSQLERALALESLVEEAVFVVGPVLVTLLATAVAPAAGLFTALGLGVVGTGLFLAQRRTEPARHLPGPAGTGELGGNRAPVRHGSALTSAGLLLLVGTFAAIGALFGFVEVGVVALSSQQQAPGAAGTMLGLWAAGSLTAGVLYGARTWRTAPATRFQVSAAAMAAGAVLVAVAAGSGSLLATTVGLIAAGTANAPTLMTGNTLVRLVVLAPNLTEAYTWLGVSVFAGIALGSAVGGALIDHGGPGAALWASAGAGVLVAGLPLVEGRHLAAR